MTRPKLILLNGFAGAGKTTIAKMYISRHPLAVMVEGDELIVNIGEWLANEDVARPLMFDMTKAILRTCLEAGHDVIMPYLATDVKNVEELEQITKGLGADFYEAVLHHEDRPGAIARLLKRGTWGERGQPPFTDADTPIMHRLITSMEEVLEKRPNIKKIKIIEDDPEHSYRQLMNYIQE